MPATQNLDASVFAEQDAELRKQLRPPYDGATAALLKRQDLHAKALEALLRRQDTEVAELRQRLATIEASLRHNAPALQAAWMHVPIGTAHAGGAGSLGRGAGGGA